MIDKEKIRAVIIGLQESGNSAQAWDVWDLLDSHIALEHTHTTNGYHVPHQRRPSEALND